jgi:hypothetical protein
MRNLIQGPDSRIVCNPGSEIGNGESMSGAVASRREDRLQENVKACPGSESRQPEAEEPVGLRSGFWAGHTTTHGIKSEGQHDRRAVRPFMEKPMRAAKALRAISQWKRSAVRILGIPVKAATGRRPEIEKEAEPEAPEEHEVTQR